MIIVPDFEYFLFSPVHTIEIASSGCDDPPANGEDCNKAVGSIVVDGEEVSKDQFGFNIVVLGYPSFKIKTVKNFNTNMDIAKSQRMSSFLMGLQGTNILLVAVKGDVAGAVSQEVWDTLVSISIETISKQLSEAY